MTPSNRPNVQCFWVVFAALVAMCSQPTFAQRRGGFNPFDRDNPFRVLSEDSTRSELKLTEDQIKQVEALQEKIREERPEQTPSFRDIQTDEDRAKLQKMMSERNEASMKQLEGILQKDQISRLNQLRLQSLGIGAFTTEKVAQQLKLSEEQQAEITKLQQEHRGLFFNRELDRDAREKMQKEIEGKVVGVLNEQQQSHWKETVGPPPAAEQTADTSTKKPATPTTTPPATTPAPTYTPPENAGPVVVSFSGASEAASNDPKKPSEGLIQFNLENAPWELVLNQFARKANLTPQILDIPPGSLTYVNDPQKYTPTEALDILHGYLLQKGFVMIKRDRFLVVLSIDKRPIPPNLIPNVSIAELEQGEFGKHELLNVVLPLEGAEANDAAREVELLKGPQGTVVPLSVSNSLVVTDTYTNLKRIHNLLKGVTTKVDPEEMQFKSFPLQHVSAGEAEVIVRDQLGIGSGVTNVSASYDRSRYGSSRSSSSSSSSTQNAKVTADPRTNALLVTGTKNQLAICEQVLTTIDVSDADVPNPAAFGKGIPFLRVYRVQNADAREVTKTLDAIMPGVVVNEDGREGTIHIKATERQQEEVARLISQLDGGGTQAVAVIPLSQLDPIGAAATLRALFTGDGDLAPVIEADSYGRRLMIRGSTDQVSQVKLLLAQLGEDGTGSGAQYQDRGPFRTVPLGGRDAEEFARILEQVWGRSSNTPVRVVVPSNNPIRGRVIPSLQDQTNFPIPKRGEPTSERTRRDLDDSTTAVTKPAVYDVSVLQDEAAEDKTDEAKLPATLTLRVNQAGDLSLEGEAVNTSQLSIRLTAWKEQVPEADRTFIVSTHPETPTAKSFPIISIISRLGIEPTLKMSADEPVTAKPAPEKPAEAGQPQPPANAADGKLPITMTVRGGDLMLFDPSGKSEDLDEMEALIEQLSLAIPPRTTWTVYYLRSAEATETATMLEQLFPSSSVGSGNIGDDGSLFGELTSSLGSLGNSLVDAAGLNSLTQNPSILRIIPEVRSNSLFVSGPADQVSQVEQMLRVLDADELPETLRERVPRMIPVEYANVNEVATIVKDVYSDFLQQDRGSQGGRANPFEMMLNGGRGGNNNSRSRQQSTVRMTIGVDAQTSKLVVSASDDLFRQVEDMVADLDKAAFEARQTVQVVSVGQADSVVLQEALSALLPSVSVSSTQSNNSRSPSSESRSPFSQGDAERRAAFIEQMRRSQSGGNSGQSSRGSFPTGRPSFGGGNSGGGRPSFFGGGGGRGSSSGSSRGGSGRGRGGR